MLILADILSEDGPLADFIPDYAVRPQQIEMAEAIADAIQNGQSLICEAGTGTGKTFAYLIPAIQSGLKIIISTGTKHLQDQLYQRDLQIVMNAIGRPIQVALLKGRNNYLCLQRLARTESNQDFLSKGDISRLHSIRLWSHQTDSGDLSELTSLPEGAPVRQFISSTTENCLGQDCDYFDDCFVFKARRQASEADLTIVNHHLLFADIVLREQGYGELLPVADVVIFDEAHLLPDLALHFFSQTFSSHQLSDLIHDSRAAYFDEAADMPDFLAVMDRVEIRVRQLRLAFGQGNIRVAWHTLKDMLEVSDALESLMAQCDEICQLLDAFANRGKQLHNCFRRFTAILNTLDQYLERSTADTIQWLETRGNSFLMHQTPLDVAEIFQERLAEYDCQCIYTSATLTVNNKFDHFSQKLGLHNVRDQSWQSPFDFYRQALLYLPTGLSDPRSHGYTEQVVQAAIPILKLTRGRAFFLYTSHRALKIAARLIHEFIDYPILIQGEAPRTELLESFRQTKHAVLLGTHSFWEGVDVKGQALSCVIIDKLPFASPDDPVMQARMKKLEEQGRSPFKEFQLPEAVITLKQGVGRLIRDSADYGVLMICDSRLLNKFYGKTFLRSLPEMHHTSSVKDVEQFFSQHENSIG